MKMLAYAVEAEERPIFARYQKECGIALTLTQEKPSMKNLEMARGMVGINVLSDTVLTPEMWDAWYAMGVRFAVTRCIGMTHMNREYAESLGIYVTNITYSSASVADYAIMMMLMVLRCIKPAMQRNIGQDYTVAALRGRELPNMTVGIVGAGRIGCTLAKHLGGFGCRVLYWNRTPKPEMEPYAAYRPLDELLAESDILSLHIALNEQTLHFMDSEKMLKMKRGAVLINTGRGGLVDSSALIAALECGLLSAAGLDVVDGDQYIYYRDHKNEMLKHHEMAILNSMPNVLMLPHLAYFTDQALEDMVHNSLIAAQNWEMGQN